MGRSLFWKLLFDDSDEDEIMNRRLKSSTSQRKCRRYIRRNHLKRDNAQRLGLSSLQKMTTTIRMLAYGVMTDFMDEYVWIGETTAMESMKKFIVAVVDIFFEQYLRSPNNEDIARLLAHCESCRFPGMLGSIDCMHWQ